MKNKTIKFLTSILVIMMFALFVGQSIVFAASKTFMLSLTRGMDDSETKYAYALNTGDNHRITQIISLGENNQKLATNFYCLNATKGASWGEVSLSGTPEYTASYDMIKDKSEIESLTTTYSNTVKQYNTQLMWILDHIHVDGGISVKNLLAKAGIEEDSEDGIYYYNYKKNPNSVFSDTSTDLYRNLYGNMDGYYITKDGAKKEVLLSKELVESVQQAVIWYYTNYKGYNDSRFNCYTNSGATSPKEWLRYDINPTVNNQDWKQLIDYTEKDDNNHDVEVGRMLQEQASILYNYFIDSAEAAARNGYTSTSEGTIELKFKGNDTDLKMTTEGENYKIGPLEIKITGNTTTTEIIVEKGTTDITSKATISGNTKTSPATDREFYVLVPKAEVANIDGVIKVGVKGKYTSTDKTLWIGKITDTEANVEQPIVEVTPVSKNIEDSLTVDSLFDLALRKTILDVDGKTAIKNEKGLDAARNIKIDTSTINGEETTATYKHRKDPIVISEGSVITYQIHIYNEGDIDGYASKIVDQLPSGLESVLKTNDTVKSTLGNTYNVTYDTTTNKITLAISQDDITNKTAKNIASYKGGNDISSDTITLKCKVTGKASTDGKTKKYLTNIAYILEEYDKYGNKIERDRSNTESRPSVYPNKTAEELNSTDKNNYKGNDSNPSVDSDTNNDTYFKGQEDEDDFEKVVLLPKPFDLKLMKYISAINDKPTTRTITINSSNLNKVVNGKVVTTADYDVSKVPLLVKTGDYVTYTFRIYNEGEVDGYAKEISEDIPEGLEYDASVNTNPAWTVSNNGKTITTDFLSKAKGEDNLLKAFDSENDDGKGSGLSYKDVSVKLKVVSTDTKNIIRNEAAITKDENSEGEEITDRDSVPEDWKKEDSDDNYEDNPEYPKYKEDDEDYDNIKLATFDLALRKFITKISTDGNFEDTNTTTTYNRVPQVDSSKLKAGTAQTAIYNHSKEPIYLNIGDYVLYTIRAYNEGDIAGYASEIVDYLPENIDFVDSTDEYIKGINDKWSYDAQTRKVTTKTDKLLNAFDAEKDNGKGSGLSYVDVQIICKINKNAPTNKKLTNIAEITEYKDEDGKVIEPTIGDRDSKPENFPEDLKDEETRPDYNGGEDKDKTDDYIPGQEDDDDFEKVIVKENPKFDLALRKFITDISGKEVTTRIPEVEYKDNKITYTHPKDVVKVVVGDTVTYTLRVFNEGEIAGFAEKVSDDIPEYLEFLPEHKTNRDYRWVMYDKDGNATTKVSEAVKIVTDYTSKAYGETLMQKENLKENPNLLNAFDKTTGVSDTNPDYVDVKVAFKVKDPNSNTYVIVNKAQISEDADKDGKPVEDIDSTPDEWKEGEDDQDYENVGVEYFDLSLLKYVTKAIVIENGKTKTTTTGNNGSDSDITPKVEIYRKNIKKTIVKFEYVIKITNEGDIAGYAKEITDYVPEGLKFYEEDNKGWKDEGDNVISTELLKDTLLQPGQSATVKVVLRWINGENNLSLKTNIAEISKDENEKGIPDRDSTPDNKKPGEDDIDDAPVLLTISTGILENTIAYVSGALVILVVIGLGLVAIKKFVL
ncbi:MAG: hypothetical protein ILA02_05885 [Clostridia bacterium]|nr:hypothetical protein [Clostridia bacterium]